MLFEEERRDIGKRVAGGGVSGHCTTIDDGIIDVGELFGKLIQRCLHQEAYGNDQAALTYALRSQGEILYIVILRLCLNDLFSEVVLGFSSFVAPIGQLVEAPVIQAADVSYQ